MPIGFTTIWPLGVGSIYSGELDPMPDFPAQFSPLAGSIDLTEGAGHRRMQLGDGYEHRQADDVAGALTIASMSFLGSERKDLDILTGFLRLVGSSTAFRMDVPGSDGQYWYRDQFKKKHISSHYWQVDVTLSETRRP